MAKEIQVAYPTSAVNLYAVILSSVGQFYNTVGAAFENFNAANWADYDIALTEQSTTGVYLGDFPALAAGTYSIAFFLRAGGSPAVTDDAIAAGIIGWDGSAVINPPSVAMIQAGTSLLDLAVMIQGDGTAAAKFTAAALSLAPTGGGGAGGGMTIVGSGGVFRKAVEVTPSDTVLVTDTVPLEQQYGIYFESAGDLVIVDEDGDEITLTFAAGPGEVHLRAKYIKLATTVSPVYVLKSKVRTS